MPSRDALGEPHVCDVCGAPATMLAIDMWRHEPPGAPYVVYTQRGKLKRGCAEHPVESMEFATEEPPNG